MRTHPSLNSGKRITMDKTANYLHSPMQDMPNIKNMMWIGEEFIREFKLLSNSDIQGFRTTATAEWIGVRMTTCSSIAEMVKTGASDKDADKDDPIYDNENYDVWVITNGEEYIVAVCQTDHEWSSVYNGKQYVEVDDNHCILNPTQVYRERSRMGMPRAFDTLSRPKMEIMKLEWIFIFDENKQEMDFKPKMLMKSVYSYPRDYGEIRYIQLWTVIDNNPVIPEIIQEEEYQFFAGEAKEQKDIE